MSDTCIGSTEASARLAQSLHRQVAGQPVEAALEALELVCAMVIAGIGASAGESIQDEALRHLLKGILVALDTIPPQLVAPLQLVQ